MFDIGKSSTYGPCSNLQTVKLLEDTVSSLEGPTGFLLQMLSRSKPSDPSFYGWMGLQTILQHDGRTLVQHIVLSIEEKHVPWIPWNAMEKWTSSCERMELHRYTLKEMPFRPESEKGLWLFWTIRTAVPRYVFLGWRWEMKSNHGLLWPSTASSAGSIRYHVVWSVPPMYGHAGDRL